MYAVIFRAVMKDPDSEYFETANRLRRLARENYGCLDFIATSEGNLEISVSYWKTLEHIFRWKQDKEHLEAQQRERSKWYHSCQVQVVEILRDYECAMNCE